MRLEDMRASENVEDRRGMGVGRTGAGLGLGTIVLIRMGHVSRARIAAVVAVAAVIWGWGVAQWPYLLPTSLTIEHGAAPSGTLTALRRLSRGGRVDLNRVLVLRTANNYDMQWPGGTAAERLFGEQLTKDSGYIPSLEAAHRVGSVVVHELVNGGAKYEKTVPQGK